MKPLLSIIIPTRNRPVELLVALRSAIEIQSRVDTEIIIASNGESIQGDLEGIDPLLIARTTIVRSEERLSLTQNWKFGLSFAQGIWVHFLGDDDFLILDYGVNLESLLIGTKTNGIKFKIVHFNWANFIPGDFVTPVSITSHAIKTQVIQPQLGEKWWSISPHKFPTGTAHSLIRREWLLRRGEGSIFNSISPDWYTGSLFALSESEYTSVDAHWAAIGNHPNSSIALMKAPDRAQSKVENLMAKQDGNLELRNLYQGLFPTTWLARTDALVQARATLFGSKEIELKHIVKESYKTTPKYVIKVYQVQRRTVPLFGRRHELWLTYYFLKALAQKLIHAIKDFRANFLS
jgi:glycosyltransferase involved in cell wall biosynthesis